MANNTNNNRRTDGRSAYTFKIVKNNESIAAYVGQVTGFTLKSREPILHPGKDGKADWAESSISTNDSVAAIFAQADGSYKDGTTYDDNPFLNLAAFSGLGKRVMEIVPGTRVAVSGEITKSEYNKNDGTPAVGYRLLADSVQLLGDGASLNRWCAIRTQSWEDKTYPKVSGLMAEVTKVGQLGADKNGRPYLFVQVKIGLDPKELLDRAFGTWSKDKKYYKDGTATLVFNGKAAESRVDPANNGCLKVGQLLCVSGSVEVNDYQGKRYARVRVNRSLIAKQPDADAGDGTTASAASGDGDNGTPAAEPKKKGSTAKKAASQAAPKAPKEEPDVPPEEDSAGFGLGSEDEEDLPF